jgi:hypothetical protein
MKKIIFYAITMVFVFALGHAYAEQNGVTDFKGLTYDSGPIGIPEAAMEGANAGGMREEDPGLIPDNRVTDFSGKTYDTLSDIGLAPPAIEPTVEGSHAGGMREEGAMEIFNAVTVFSGYDSN